MNAKTALCKHFLAGETLSIKSCFHTVGLTNLPREASRMIEKPFGVTLKRTQINSLSRYKQPITFFEYYLPRTPENANGVALMAQYVAKNGGAEHSGHKTDKERKNDKLL